MSLITYQLPLQTQDAEQLLQLKMKFKNYLIQILSFFQY